MEIREGLLYSKNHEWVKVLDGKAKIGITDYAQSKLGDIVFVELPEIGKELKKGEVICILESVKAASDVYSAVDCSVEEVNDRLSNEPELLNKSPYDDGWICIVSMKNKDQPKELLSPESYKKETEK
ncbi:MAG TPA: glycine cleavage system protein GcvH [Thermoplasmata archaeon]|nr:glycine cleavage system protein GcvH [Thermoplasmata archaeon]